MSTPLPVLVAVPLAKAPPDPSDVKAGWLGLAVALLLIAALVFLGFSLRKQLRRVNFTEEPDEPRGPGAAQGPRQHSGEDDGNTPPEQPGSAGPP